MTFFSKKIFVFGFFYSKSLKVSECLWEKLTHTKEKTRNLILKINRSLPFTGIPVVFKRCNL
jgi:hypothetical protein